MGYAARKNSRSLVNGNRYSTKKTREESLKQPEIVLDNQTPLETMALLTRIINKGKRK